MMRHVTRSIVMAAAVCAVAISSVQAQAHPSFAGTWVLDVSKSEASAGMPTSATRTITSHGDTLIVERETETAEAGVVKAHIVVGLDGKAWKNTITQPGVGDIETSTTLTWDNGILVATATGNIMGTDFVQTDRWVMAADGKSFVSHISVTVEGNEVQSATFTFNKKP
jgi:hypothetical protein